MSLNKEAVELDGIINRLLDDLSTSITSQTGRDGVELRHKIGDIRSNYNSMISDGTFSTELLSCFQTALTANVKLSGLFIVHQGLFQETPVGEISAAVVQMGILFCLSTESRLIVKMEFTSRDDVEAMMNKMRDVFDIARVLSADAKDTTPYQKLTILAGDLISHLSNVARPLPRMVSFVMSTSFPSVTLSQRIYYKADRAEEIVAENKIIHPAFCLREIRGLSG